MANRLPPLDDFTIEFENLARRPSFLLEISPSQAWILLGHLQLALRHPANIGPSAMIARAFANQLQDYIATTPALAAVAAAGWDPDYDQLPNNHDLTINWAYWHNKLTEGRPIVDRVLALVLRAIV